MKYGTGTCVECYSNFEKNTPLQNTCGPKCRRIHKYKVQEEANIKYRKKLKMRRNRYA
jgi:hypothetical protein